MVVSVKALIEQVKFLHERCACHMRERVRLNEKIRQLENRLREVEKG